MEKNLAPAHIEIDPYDLDEELLRAVREEGRSRMRLYRFPGRAVVMGRGGHLETELLLENSISDGINILRRRGGGCAVLLDPGNIIVSVALTLPGLGGIHEAYGALTGWLTDGLARAGIPGVRREGVTDLALGDRKIGGGCIFRERGLLFYSTTLLFNTDYDSVERYIRHPPREPDYRNRRPHREFMTSLDEISELKDAEEFMKRLETCLEALPEIEQG